jgi:hypothetical protein
MPAGCRRRGVDKKIQEFAAKITSEKNKYGTFAAFNG